MSIGILCYYQYPIRIHDRIICYIQTRLNTMQTRLIKVWDNRYPKIPDPISSLNTGKGIEKFLHMMKSNTNALTHLSAVNLITLYKCFIPFYYHAPWDNIYYIDSITEIL